MQRSARDSGVVPRGKGKKAGAIRPFSRRSAASAGSTGRAAVDAGHRPQRLLLPWLVLLVGIPASIFLFSALHGAVDNLARLRFERQASDAKGVIESRIHSYSNVLYGLRALFAMHDSVTRVQFHRFVASLDLKNRYPGFDVVNYAAYVPARDAAQFVQAVRTDTSLDPLGYPDFAIRPAGDRPEYFVVSYLEPMAGYEFAFGRDLSANPQAAEPRALMSALHIARDSGQLTASGVPIRINTDREYIGLALRLPVYRLGLALDTMAQRRAAYLGSVGAGFNIEALMKGVLSEKTLREMQFALYDTGATSARSAPSRRRLLFDSNQLVDPAARLPLRNDARETFARNLSLEVGGRIWEVDFHAPKRLAIDRVDMLLPWAVLAGGIVSSLLLCGVLFSLASSRGRALKIATDMTRHLRDSEASLLENRTLLNDAQKLSHVGCCQYDPRNGRLVWSDELYRIHGVEPGALKPTYETSMALVHPHDRTAWAAALAHALSSGLPFASEFRIVRPDGSERQLRSLGEVIAGDDGRPESLLWSVLDITEQKRTEDALRDSAAQLTALSRRLVEVQEAERRELSRELHDRVGQNLTALSINLDILRSALTNGEHAGHRKRLADSATLLESTVDSIEDVMSELRPPMLDDYGLFSALHWYAREFSDRTGIEVDVLGEGAERAAPEIEIALFRVAQEALNNVAKHAGAKRVRIELDHVAGQCVMTVTDDGIGIDTLAPAESRARRGLGMVTMRERAQSVGGRFHVRAVPGGGTQIAIEVSSHAHTNTDRR